MDLTLPVWGMVLIGVFAALIALAQRGGLAAGLVISVILGSVLWIALSFLPLPMWARQVAFSGGVGLITGLMLDGVYAHFFAKTAVRHSDVFPPIDDEPRDPHGPRES